MPSSPPTERLIPNDPLGGPILVVEDDAPIRALLVSALADDGYAVIAAADGAEALESVLRLPPVLIILDLNMPVLDGRQFLRAYRALPGPHAPVIVCTATHLPHAAAALLGADACLPKPFDLDDLSAIVQRVAPRPAGHAIGAA